MRSTPSGSYGTVFTRRLSLVDVSLNNSPKKEVPDIEIKCFMPTSSLELNSKAWRQNIAEEILSVLTREINNSVDLKTQKANFFDLMSCLVGLLYNRYNYEEFKDLDPQSFRENVANYIESHIPNLLSLNKTLSNIANSIIMLCDNPDITLPKQNFLEKLFFGKNEHIVSCDSPQFDKYTQLIKSFVEIKSHESNINVNYVKRYIRENFQTNYNYKTTSIILHIWDRNKLNLNEASCHDVELQYIRFKDKVFTKVDFRNANFKYAHLINVTFKDCDLRGACFDKTTMNGVIFDNVLLEWASFDKAILFNTHIAVRIIDISGGYKEGKAYRSHNYPHKEDKNIFKTIDSIRDDFASLKIDLINQIIRNIDKHLNFHYESNFSREIYMDFLEILLANPIYMKDNNVKDYVCRELLLFRTRRINNSITQISRNEIKLLLNYVSQNLDNNTIYYDKEKSTNKVFEFNTGINQLLYWAQEYMQEDNSIQPAYYAFRDTVFNKLEHNKKIAEEYFDKVYFDVSEKDNYHMFITTDSKYCLFLRRDDLNKFAYNKDEKDYQDLSWDRIMYSSYDGGHYKLQVLGEKAKEVFAMFPALKPCYDKYDRYMHSLIFTKYLSSLGLAEYEDFFIRAQHKLLIDVYDNKLDNIQELHANKLATIFGKFIEGGKDKIHSTANRVVNIAVTEKHYQDILENFEYSSSDHKHAAMLLFALSVVFTKYSSASYFGSEHDSPIAIRNYALALLNTAVKIYPEIFDKEKLKDYINRFVGINKGFTCTAVLSNIMREYISSSVDHKYWNKILKIASPLSWYSN